jgi:hypothetical protein
MTKWYDDQHKYRPDSDTPISVGGNWYREPQREFYCEYCQRRLSKLQNNTGNVSYYCSACSVEVDPSLTEVRSKSRLSTPEGPPETPYVSTKFTEPTVGRKPVEPKGSFAALRARGIKITNYKDEVKG